jgi:hypothetical protein
MPRKTASKAAAPAKKAKAKPRAKAKPKAPARAKKPAAPVEPKPPTSAELIDAYGIDRICARLEAGDSLRKIALEIGVPSTTIWRWAEQPEHSARTRDAAKAGAAAVADLAEKVLVDADEMPGSIAKARELAHHYRWKAKMLDRNTYGDKVEMDATVREDKLTDEQLDARLSTLARKLGFALPGNG